MFKRIDPTPENPEPSPPTSGNWIRESDGGLVPADQPTAETAGLMPDNTDPE